MKSIVLVIFTYVSIKIPRAYCRWICPTGALLGYTSGNSLIAIKRNAAKCVDGCNACEKACPTDVPITEENPDGIENNLCISCGNCSTYCEQGIDVRSYAQRGQNIVRASCVGCGVCAAVCPRGVLKLENGPEEGRFEPNPIIVDEKGIRLGE